MSHSITLSAEMFAKIANYINTHGLGTHCTITLTESHDNGMGPLYEVRVSQTHKEDISDFEAGVYAKFFEPYD